MPTSVQTAPIIGLPQYRGWSQVATNSLKNFVCAFAVEGNNANNFGRDLAEKILDLKITSSSELHQYLLDILYQARKADHKLQFSCGLFFDGGGVFATHGGNILLKRKDQIGQVLSSTTDLKIIEGKHKKTDIYVITTHQASNYLSEIKQKLTQGFDIDTIITSVVPDIHGQDNSSLSALGFIQLSSEPTSSPINGDGVDLQNSIVQDGESKKNPFSAPPENSEKLEKKTLQLKQSRDFSKIVKKILTIMISFFQLIIKFLKFIIKKLAFIKKIPIILAKIIPSKNVYVGVGGNRKKVSLVLAGLILLGIVVAGLFWRRNIINSQVSQAQEKINPILERVIQAKQEVASNPISAREKSQSAIEDIKKIAQEFQDQKQASKLIADELIKVENFNQSISGLDSLEKLPLFFDLRLVESDFIAQATDTNGENAFFLDSGKSQIIKLNLDRKQSQVLPTEDHNQLVDLVIEENQLYLLGGGIHNLDIEGENNIATIKEEGDSDKNGIFLENFGPYLYVFNPEKRNIYRYLINKEGKLSEPIGWLTNKQGLDFANIKSMAVDGDLWLTTKDGQLKKYTRGEPTDFSFVNLPEKTSTPLIVYTKENLENLYLLEPEKRRLLIVKKDGQFLREIKSKSFASATSVMASEELGKAFAISGSIVFEVKL